ncbi:MAG: MopE-related protein [Myxococcota bacterium]
MNTFFSNVLTDIVPLMLFCSILTPGCSDGGLNVRDCDPSNDAFDDMVLANLDADGDGYGSQDVTEQICPGTPGYVDNASDCDDRDAERNPSQPERCDGIDNNCNKEVDEGVTQTFFRDADGDRFGDPDLTLSQEGCEPDTGYVDNDLDCDDTDANVNPDAAEIADGVDTDCDESTGGTPQLIELQSWANTLTIDAEGPEDELTLVGMRMDELLLKADNRLYTIALEDFDAFNVTEVGEAQLIRGAPSVFHVDDADTYLSGANRVEVIGAQRGSYIDEAASISAIATLEGQIIFGDRGNGRLIFVDPVTGDETVDLDRITHDIIEGEAGTGALMATGDVDGDGISDLIVADNMGLTAYSGRALDRLSSTYLFSYPLPDTWRLQAIGVIDDIDGDGLKDIAVSASVGLNAETVISVLTSGIRGIYPAEDGEIIAYTGATGFGTRLVPITRTGVGSGLLISAAPVGEIYFLSTETLISQASEPGAMLPLESETVTSTLVAPTGLQLTGDVAAAPSSSLGVDVVCLTGRADRQVALCLTLLF